MAQAAKDRARQLQERGVDIRLNTVLSEELLDELHPDAVVFASGGAPIRLRVPGVDGTNIYAIEDVLAGKTDLSGAVAIIGGGLVGLESAEYLAENEKITAITVVKMAPQCGVGLGASRRNGVFGNLKAHHVKLLTRAKCTELRPNAVVYERKGETKELPCDNIVMAVGSKPADLSAQKAMLDARSIPYYVIGGALKCPRRAIDAVREAANLSLEL